jgi:hypothetical protein
MQVKIVPPLEPMLKEASRDKVLLQHLGGIPKNKSSVAWVTNLVLFAFLKRWNEKRKENP